MDYIKRLFHTIAEYIENNQFSLGFFTGVFCVCIIILIFLYFMHLCIIFYTYLSQTNPLCYQRLFCGRRRLVARRFQEVLRRRRHKGF